MSFPTKVDMPNHLVTLLRTPVFEETYLGQGQGKNLQFFVRKCELLPGGGATEKSLRVTKIHVVGPVPVMNVHRKNLTCFPLEPFELSRSQGKPTLSMICLSVLNL